MGMYCTVTASSRQDAEGFTEDTDVLSSLFGRSRNTATSNRVSLEKSWHGLHYLLTGEVWEGQGPLAFLLAGGKPLGDDEESPLRFFSAEETAEIHQALSAVSDDLLWSRFDAQEMEQQQVYPGIWDEDEEDLKDEYLTYFNALKQVVAAAHESQQGLLVNVG